MHQRKPATRGGAGRVDGIPEDILALLDQAVRVVLPVECVKVGMNHLRNQMGDTNMLG